MKRGIFFWGFSNLDLVSELSRRVKRTCFIEECYVQIPYQEKTVYLLEMFPEEVIRAPAEDLRLLQQWLIKNNQREVIVVLNFWPFLLNHDFSETISLIQEMIRKKNRILIVCPKFYPKYEFIFSRMNLNISPHIRGIFSVFLQKVKILHESILNLGSSSFLLCTPICDSLISNKQTTVIYEYRTILCFHVLHTLVRNYSSSYLTRRGLVASVINKVTDMGNISDLSSNRKDNMFRFTVDSDATYQFARSVGGNIWSRGIFISSAWLDKLSENQMQQEEFLSWCRCMGIIEYQLQSQESSAVNSIHSLFFSSFSPNHSQQ